MEQKNAAGATAARAEGQALPGDQSRKKSIRELRVMATGHLETIEDLAIAGSLEQSVDQYREIMTAARALRALLGEL